MARSCFAPEPGDEQAGRRSLVLAGGGMRVAYQAGVMVALHRAGLRFHHVDGTSGGTINLSMLLTGQTTAEMCDRWRALDPRGFSAPLPWRDYLRSVHWPGLGGDRGVRRRVFPGLGIDVAAVRRADGVVGTYNVANFATKTAEVFEHRQVDEDLLVAAISLPVLMPAVQRDGDAYTDAVWIRDSNVPEAVRQGSDDIWLVWCIGNTPRYQNGSFRQYVHMIEMAASGSLYGDLQHLAHDPIGSNVHLHVIKPARPIPLDPDYMIGRVDAASLIGMGYRDARSYLRRPQPRRAPWGPDVTAMQPVEPGVAGRLALAGHFKWADGTAGDGGVHLRFETSPGGEATGEPGVLVTDAVGDVTLPGWPPHQLIEGGVVRFGGPERVSVSLELLTESGRCELRGRAGRGVLEIAIYREGGNQPEGSGSFVLGPAQLLRVASSLQATGDGRGMRAAAARAILRLALGIVP